MAHQNYSKSKPSSPQWAKWRQAGATGQRADFTDKLQAYDKLAYEKFAESVRDDDAIIDARSINYENNLVTLSIGKKRAPGYCYLVVPVNDSPKLGEKLTRLPSGAVSVERVYGVREPKKFSLTMPGTPKGDNLIQLRAEPRNVQRRETGREHYVQTNELGYVTGVVEEGVLVGLFGGTRSMILNDEQAGNVRKLLTACHREGNGLHIDDIVNFGPIIGR